MAKRSAGGGLWLVFGTLALFAMVPKEVWIGLGVIGAIALVAYLVIKHLGQKERHEPYRDEPTLGELMAKSGPQRSARRTEALSSGRPRSEEHSLNSSH